jgi:hypothetical protein
MDSMTDEQIDVAEKRFVGHGDSLAQSTFRQVFAQAKRANALAAECERLRAADKHWQGLDAITLDGYAKERIAKESAEADALREDAERYRYLRDVDGDISVCKGFDSIDVGSSGVAYTYDDIIIGADLDAAIDAARKGE